MIFSFQIPHLSGERHFQRRISPLDSNHYFWLQDFHIFMSCHQILTDMVDSNQSHGVVTFSDFLNTPNITVTGGMWEASGW